VVETLKKNMKEKKSFDRRFRSDPMISANDQITAEHGCQMLYFQTPKNILGMFRRTDGQGPILKA
jgi:hypothetical protein